ncbi:hypothetical protein CDIK_4291 [Cucumispora dikerogammari]|nr:hypothetical protein CDIK_4291 [Cucumispora dikerogammari]
MSFSKSTISYHLNKYKKQLSMDRKSWSGRRSLLDNEEKKVLVNEIHKNSKLLPNKLKNIVRNRFSKTATDQTIRDTLSYSDLNKCVARNVSCITYKVSMIGSNVVIGGHRRL